MVIVRPDSIPLNIFPPIAFWSFLTTTLYTALQTVCTQVLREYQFCTDNTFHLERLFPVGHWSCKLDSATAAEEPRPHDIADDRQEHLHSLRGCANNPKGCVVLPRGVGRKAFSTRPTALDDLSLGFRIFQFLRSNDLNVDICSLDPNWYLRC